jgi:precorrin-2 dehydrogenase / sirohydrochlorin ferrochelatase
MHYVACLDLSGRRCLVIGAGPMADEKADMLRACGADVVRSESFEPGQLDGTWLVVVADRKQGESVFAAATARNVFCNVADEPALCSFILPAIHRRGLITLAVSTSGASPALAQRLRDELGSQIGAEHEELAEALRRLRPWARRTFATYDERRDFFRNALAKALG